jgi:hypothetical protein
MERGWTCNGAGHAVRPQACWWWGSVPTFFFALVLQGLNSGVVRTVWPRACRRQGCAPVGVLPVCASHRHGRVRKRLCTVWWRPTHAGRCVPPSIMGESRNGSTRCGGGRQPRDCLLVCASHCRGRVWNWLHTVWWRPASPPSV